MLCTNTMPRSHYAAAKILLDVLRQRTRLHIFGMKEPKFAAALPNADHDFLVAVPIGPSASTTANKGFVHFDFATQGNALNLRHCRPDAMAEIPCGLVRLDSERAFNLTRAHAFFGFAEQQCGKKPRHKRKVCIVEDRIDCNAELVFA